MISIIIPVYNVASYLVKCLDSCFSQNNEDLEVLAIDDGSCDGSGHILDNYALRESRLRVFHQKNAGVVTARNRGIAEAKGDWLMFVDSDDYLPAGAVDCLIHEAIRMDADIVVGGFYLDCVGKRIKQNDLLPYGESEKGIACALLTENLKFSLCGKIFRSCLFKNIRSDEKLKIGEDAYMIIQLCCNVRKITVIDTPVYYYVQRMDSVLHHPDKEAVHSRLLFIDCLIEYYAQKEYFEESSFKSCIHRFILNEMFGYFLLSGKYNTLTSRQISRLQTSIKDKSVRKLLPRQRFLLLKIYCISPFCGEFLMSIYKGIKTIIGKRCYQ